MTVSAGDAHEYPIYAGRYRVYFPLLDADGDLVAGATTPDCERSIDGGTFADCTNEMTEVATSSGVYYLDLIGAEMTSKCTVVIAKSATAGMKTTVLTLYPKRLLIRASGTAQAGAAATITLAVGSSTLDNFYKGSWIQCTNNSPAGVLGQTRQILAYVGSTLVATVDAAWGTNPSVATTYEVLSDPEWAPSMGTGEPLADIQTWRGTQVNALVSGRVDASAGALAAGVVTAAAVATGAIDADAIATDAVTEINAPILAVLGALADAAADGDPTSADTVMQYVKQLVNILVGTVGVVTFPAAAAPANNVSLAEAIRQIYDKLVTTTIALPGQAAPSNTPTMDEVLGWLYKFMRNKTTQTATTLSLFNDAGDTVDAKSTVSDDATTFTRGEFVTGP